MDPASKNRITTQRTTTGQHLPKDLPVEHARITAGAIPGEVATGSFFQYVQDSLYPATNSYQINDWNAVSIYDPHFMNCVLVDEVVACQWDADRDRMQVVGSFGLVRQAVVASVSPPSSGSSSSLDEFPVLITATLLQDPTKAIVAVAADSTGVTADDIIWVQYQPGASGGLIEDGLTIANPEPIKYGQWVVMETVHFNGASSSCITIPGVNFDLIPTVDARDATSVLAIMNGCLVQVEIGDCDSSAGSGSSSVPPGSSSSAPPP